MRNAVLLFVVVLACACEQSPAQWSSTLKAPQNNTALYHGCRVFPVDDWYNAPVLHAQVDAHSGDYVKSMFDNGDAGGFVVYDVDPPAFRVNLATSAAHLYPVQAVAWHQNEFPDPVPWDPSFVIEAQSDGHAIVLNTQTCKLTEFYQARFVNGQLSAYSGWTWDLHKPLTAPGNNQPASTASGLPIFAGLLKGEEIESSAPIDHALNFAPPVGSISPNAWVLPATNTGGCGGCSGPQSWPVPYGAHLRLRKNFVLTCGVDCPQAQRIAEALKIYGAYISDTGSKGTGNQLAVAFDAAGHNPWKASDLANLEQIHITDMEVLPLGSTTRR